MEKLTWGAIHGIFSDAIGAIVMFFVGYLIGALDWDTPLAVIAIVLNLSFWLPLRIAVKVSQTRRVSVAGTILAAFILGPSLLLSFYFGTYLAVGSAI